MQNGGKFNDIGHYHLHIFPRYENDGFGWKYGEEPKAVSIIGCADEPTSVFIAGKSQKNSTDIMVLKKRISKIKRKDILLWSLR